MRKKFEYYNEYRKHINNAFSFIEEKIRKAHEDLERKRTLQTLFFLCNLYEKARAQEEEERRRRQEEEERRWRQEEEERRRRQEEEERRRRQKRFLLKVKLISIGTIISIILGLLYYAYYKYYPKQGTIVYDDGSVYMGRVKNGKANGENGRMAYGDGKECVGAFIDDILSGYGECTYPNGGRYIGNFLDGKRNGYGEFFMANGNIYKGDFLLGDLHGQGELLYAKSGIVYKGNFEYNKINGYGRIFGKDNEDEACIGEFDDRLIKCEISDGRKISSQYNPETMQFHGKAVITFPDGESKNVIFKNNVRVE